MAKNSSDNQTPLMRQYWEIKSSHPDKILLFRMGDFFEMFFDDAVTAAPILGIALTSRNKKAADETPMCGVPHHSISGPINKLLAAGMKVAICDQIEDPKFAKGIVKRAVTRILTPGMVYDPETLEATIANYLACFDDGVLACADMTTGEAIYWETLSIEQAGGLVRALPIAEFVQASETDLPFPIECLISRLDEIKTTTAEKPLRAIQRILAYVETLGAKTSLNMIRPFERRSLKGRLELSPTTIRHLEIFSSSRGEKDGTLFSAVNRTKSSIGARQLRTRLAFPKTNFSEIEAEWSAVESWTKNPQALRELREQLSQVGDLERRLTRIAPSTANGRDLRSLQESIGASLSCLILARKEFKGSAELERLVSEIERSIVEDPPLSVKQGHMFKTGVSKDLDEAIRYSTQGQDLLAELETREKNRSGISSLKVRYNNVFGYYIEITNSHKDKVPRDYQRKQTLANAERYTTDELVELERKVLSAQSRRFDLEQALFEDFKSRVLSLSRSILELAHLIGDLDVVASFASLAIERNYKRPVISKSGKISLKASRHPVVEKSSQFVSNDIDLEPKSCLLLTGPNMAGKSTLMRQVALTAILAQAGSFVPADVAELPVFERILTRIGAQDSLSEGLSTFMVEMKETADIIKRANDKSLVILDEIGRGTSTYDGLSLAQAILEHLMTSSGAYLFFATHYHELTQLENLFPNVRNGHMAISEKKGEIRFLYTLREGPAQKSYGIHVAQLAGLPHSLTERAKNLLSHLEKTGGQEQQMSLAPVSLSSPAKEIPGPVSKIVDDLKDLSINSTTPLQALMKITEWQNSIQD